MSAINSYRSPCCVNCKYFNCSTEKGFQFFERVIRTYPAYFIIWLLEFCIKFEVLGIPKSSKTMTKLVTHAQYHAIHRLFIDTNSFWFCRYIRNKWHFLLSPMLSCSRNQSIKMGLWVKTGTIKPRGSDPVSAHLPLKYIVGRGEWKIMLLRLNQKRKKNKNEKSKPGYTFTHLPPHSFTATTVFGTWAR